MKTSTKKKMLALGAVAIIMIMLTACSTEMKVIGKWYIKNVSIGGMEMTEQDFKDFGISSGGSVKFRKSGKCDIDLLGDEYEGTWSIDDKDVITIKYNKTQATATLKDKVMTMTDANNGVYTMEK